MPEAWIRADWSPRPPPRAGDEGQLVLYLSSHIVEQLPESWGVRLDHDLVLLYRPPEANAPPGVYRIVQRRDEQILASGWDNYRYAPFHDTVTCRWEGYAVWATGPDGQEYLVGYSPVPVMSLRVSHGLLPRVREGQDGRL